MSRELVLDWALTWLFLAQLALILWNQRALGRPLARLWEDDAPLVSVLVPARNEEDAIGRCLRSLLAQDYPNLEILVLDDGSTDGTAAIVREVGGSRVRLLAGGPAAPGLDRQELGLPPVVPGGPGDLLCFVDSDTTLAPGTISAAAGLLEEEGAGLVSLLPRAARGSVSGAVLLPMVPHAMYALFPMAAMHRGTHPVVAVAFGPFLLLARRAYAAAGGHAARRDSIVDDVELSRAVKAAGHPVRLANGTDLVETRWYTARGHLARLLQERLRRGGLQPLDGGGSGAGGDAGAAAPLLPGGPGHRGRGHPRRRPVAGGPAALRPDAHLPPRPRPAVDDPAAPLHGGLLGPGPGLVGDALGHPPRGGLARPRGAHPPQRSAVGPALRPRAVPGTGSGPPPLARCGPAPPPARPRGR